MAFFKTRDGVDIYYEVHGEGEQTIILCHGGGCSCKYFKHNIEALSDHTKLVLWDFRGHGRSGFNHKSTTADSLADDIADLILEISAENVFLAGWSIGGLATMAYIRKYGCVKLKAQIVIDWSPCPRAEEGGDYSLSWFGNTGNEGYFHILRSGLNDKKASKEQLVANAYGDREGMEENGEWLLREHDMVYQPFRMCQQIIAGTEDFREDLTGLPIPFAFFTGTKALFPTAIDWYKKHIPDTTIYCYENAIHSLFMRNIEDFNHDFVEFVDSHS